MSTRDFQDPVNSRRWQHDMATDVIDTTATIVVKYSDIGCSRRLAWTDRPQVTALLAAAHRLN